MIEPLPVQLALIDRVRDRLVNAIADGTLEPGARITQEDIAIRLGVSRQPVSHALQILRNRGLLVETGRRGLIVAPLDATRLLHLYQVRAALDSLAASLAATKAKAGDLSSSEQKEGRAVVAKGTALVENGTIGELIAADVEFHSMIHRWSGNEAIDETVKELWPHFMRSMGVVLSITSLRGRVWREHGEILDFILRGKAAEAERVARRHTAVAGEEASSRLEADRSQTQAT